jgi:hypothetical protein
MAKDDDWYKPHRPLMPTRQPQPGEMLFEFYRQRDHTHWLCELRQHPEPYGVEAMFFRNEELDSSRRFDRRMDPTRPPRELAIAWAEEWRKGMARETAASDSREGHGGRFRPSAVPLWRGGSSTRHAVVVTGRRT